MKKQIKVKLFPITLLILSMFIFFCTSRTVMGQTREKQQSLMENQSYDCFEAEYLSQLRELLGENGFSNAGITMTRISGEDGTRNYEILLHHRRFEGKSRKEREALLGKLDGLSFPVEGCTFTFQIF